jgi:hypothetical protein
MNPLNRIEIEAKPDFLERLSTAPPIKALSELIWNGMDAGAEIVSVSLEQNGLDGITLIRVRDTGRGISHSEVQKLFGNLGNSWKKAKGRHAGRALHGKNGQGRFKAFALGNKVEWRTVYDSGSGPMQFHIVGTGEALTDLQFSDPVSANGKPTGTEVIISGIEKSLGTLQKDNAKDELAKIFAAYLSQYPDVILEYDGVRVDPSVLQTEKKDLPLEEIHLHDGRVVTASVTVIEWSAPAKRMIHLCDADGVSLHETEIGQKIRAPGFEFTTYVKSHHFRELDKTGALSLDELHPDVRAILGAANRAVQGHFRRKLGERQSQTVERWKSEQIYPFESKVGLNPVEEAERQVFDILAVHVESYLPAFDEADHKSKRFMFRLLAQAVQESPDSVQKIITEVLNLKPDDQEALSDLLEITTLSSVISSAKTVADRLDFLIGLENLLFDKATKRKFTERDQLHKILENEAWIFNEEFALSGSEMALEEVLQEHIGTLRPVDATIPVLREGGQEGRVDLMFSRMVKPRHDERDYLVVELKRPSQSINSKILSQVESYAIAVAQDPRFLKEKTRWRFIVVSNSMDDYAKRKATQRNRHSGLTYDDGDLNIEVWAYEWTEILAKARARLEYINKALRYEASRETSRAYLEEVHAKFIPRADSFSEEFAAKADAV